MKFEECFRELTADNMMRRAVWAGKLVGVATPSTTNRPYMLLVKRGSRGLYADPWLPFYQDLQATDWHLLPKPSGLPQSVA